MTDTIDLLGIVGSTRNPSKTAAAVAVALQAAEKAHGVKTSLLNLADHRLEVADGRKLHEYDEDTRRALDLVMRSRAFVIGTPIYRGAYSGALKLLLDLVPRKGWEGDVEPLANRAVGLVATGATAHHHLAIDQELRPALAFFGAHVVGGSAYAHSEHFSNGEVVDEAVRARLEALGRATVELSRAIEASPALSSLGPQI